MYAFITTGYIYKVSVYPKKHDVCNLLRRMGLIIKPQTIERVLYKTEILELAVKNFFLNVVRKTKEQ